VAARFGAAAIVVTIFLVGLLVLRVLSTLGPIQAGVNGSIEKSDATVWFTAAGVVAAYVIVVVIGLVAVYLLAR
jgi:hypothetical protein